MVDQGSQGLLSPYLRKARLDAARPWLRGRVLDIGCGTGALAEWCSDRDYVGFDADSSSLSMARLSRPNHRFVEQIPLQEEFDTVAALAVIEHLVDPDVELKKWSSRLAPHGRVVLTTPHRAFHTVHEIGAKLGVFSLSAAEEHEEMFDRKSLYRLATQCGLKPIKYERFLWGANQLFVAEIDR